MMGRRVARALAAALAAAGALAAGAAGAQGGGDLDVPFITTPDRVTLAMLELAGVGPADRLLDLGSGDGRIVITAAKRFGATGLGVDLVPDLVAKSQENARRAGVADRAMFRVQDLFDTPLGGATVITLYLLPEVNLQLRPRLLALAPGTRIVSHDWDMGDWPPDRTLVLDVPEKAIGRDKRSRLMLWVVPARLQGLWCGPGGMALRIAQQFQQVTATLEAPDAAGRPAQALGLGGRIDGRQLRLQGAGGDTAWAAQQLPDGRLRWRQVPPDAPVQAGQLLLPAAGAACPAG